jgi:hypothetical protein
LTALPYITSSGNIDKVLAAIKAAAVPERVSQDFVKTILKIPGGSGDQMTAYLKKLNFTGPDSRPTDLYTRFRNPTSSGKAVASAIKFAYSPLYIRHEFMHELNDNDLLGLIVEETGQPHDSNPVKMTFACIKALKKHADFGIEKEDRQEKPIQMVHDVDRSNGFSEDSPRSSTGIGFNLGYTINLNLPATSDPEVFNAIFKSLKAHLLRDDDV